MGRPAASTGSVQGGSGRAEARHTCGQGRLGGAGGHPHRLGEVSAPWGMTSGAGTGEAMETCARGMTIEGCWASVGTSPTARETAGRDTRGGTERGGVGRRASGPGAETHGAATGTAAGGSRGAGPGSSAAAPRREEAHAPRSRSALAWGLWMRTRLLLASGLG